MGFCGRFELEVISGSHLSPCFLQAIAIALRGLLMLPLLIHFRRLVVKFSLGKAPKELGYLPVTSLNPAWLDGEVCFQVDGAGSLTSAAALAADRTVESHRQLQQRSLEQVCALVGVCAAGCVRCSG